MNNKSYAKKENNRKLSKFSEYNIMNVGWVVSLVLFLVVLSIGYDSEIGIKSYGAFYFSFAYLAAAVIGFVLSIMIRIDIIATNDVKKITRMLAFILIPFVFTGNFFISIAGFSTIKKEKNIEYVLSFYSFISTIMIIMVSALNLFKPYVANNFLTGIYALVALSVFYLIMTVLTGSVFTTQKKNYKNLLVPGIISILTGISGNLFALCLGLVIFSRVKNMNKNRTVEWIDVIRRVFRNYMSVIGMFIVVFLLSLSICSYLTFDYSIAIDNDYMSILRTPSLMFPFGTDEYGRCIFTRIIFGARISLIIGFVSTAVPIVIGGLLGAGAGYYGGKLDNIVMRILDVLYAVPSILLAIAIIAAFGANTLNLILALSIGAIPSYARTMRAQVLSVSSNEYVEAAKACGVGENKIILKHIIPNALSPMIVRATLSIGGAVLSTSSLSFLGLGVEPHIPEWGAILRGGTAYLETHSYLAIFPGLAIMMIVLAFNFFGDGLRDALDPKLK